MPFLLILTLFNRGYIYLTRHFHIHRQKLSLLKPKRDEIENKKLLLLSCKRSWRKATEEIENKKKTLPLA